MSDELLASYLAARDEPCPRCGYNLRGLREPRCPECGDALRLRVGLVEPRMGTYMTALLAAGLAAGAGLLLGVVALLQAPLDWWWDFAGAALALLTIYGAAATGLLLIGRRWFMRREGFAQATIALMVWVVALVLAGCVIVFFDD